MKKWQEYTPQEKRMIVVLIILIIIVAISWGRISEGLQRGRNTFFGKPDATVQVSELKCHSFVE